MTRRVRAFKRWMRARGVNASDALELADSPGFGGLSVRSRCRLASGDLVATIPKAACLTAMTSGARGIIEDAGLSGTLALTLAVMYERSLGCGSPWDGYLQLLPERECVPLVWSLQEVDALLMGTELHEAVKDDKSLVYEDWKEVIGPLIDSWPKLDPDDFSVEKFFSTKTLVSSRSFKIDDFHGFGMVPLADLFNHKTGAENVHFTSVSYISSSDGEGDGERSDASGDGKSSIVDLSSSSSGDDPEVLEMIIVRDVEAGDEVFNTYGSMGNAALLHRYGFTEPDNPFDLVNIDLNLVMNWCSSTFSNRYFRARLSLWRRLNYTGCISQSSEYFEISFDGEAQLELLVLLFIIFLGEDAYQKLSYMVDSFVEANEATKIVNLTKVAGSKFDKSPEKIKEPLLTDSVCHALVSLAGMRESLYGSGLLEEDVNKLRNCCHIRERKLYNSLVLRVSERKILAKLRTNASKWSKSKKRKAKIDNGKSSGFKAILS